MPCFVKEWVGGRGEGGAREPDLNLCPPLNPSPIRPRPPDVQYFQRREPLQARRKGRAAEGPEPVVAAGRSDRGRA
jgi:hypothetical protein